MNQLAVQDRYLHRMATKSVKSIQSRVSKEPEFAAAAVSGLTGPAGSINFDQVTKTKTLEKIVVEADTNALGTIVSLFERLIKNPGTADAKVAASSRHILTGLLVAIVRARAPAPIQDDSAESVQAILEKILVIFLRFAYFTNEGVGNEPATEPALSESARELFRSRINSCLNTLIANQRYAAAVPYAVVHKIHDAEKSGEFGKCIVGMDGAVRASVKTAFKSLKKLSKKVSATVYTFSRIGHTNHSTLSRGRRIAHPVSPLSSFSTP